MAERVFKKKEGMEDINAMTEELRKSMKSPKVKSGRETTTSSNEHRSLNMQFNQYDGKEDIGTVFQLTEFIAEVF